MNADEIVYLDLFREIEGELAFVQIDGRPVRRSASGVLLLDGAWSPALRTGVTDAPVLPVARRRPVFVDDSGRRARVCRLLALPLVWIVAMGAGLFAAALVHDLTPERAPAVVSEEPSTAVGGLVADAAGPPAAGGSPPAHR
jgi:hypothetical protein